MYLHLTRVFIGRAFSGPINEPVRVLSFADYDRVFGGLWSESPMSFAIQHYFNNGGQMAIVVRLEAKKTCSINFKWPFFHRNNDEGVRFREIADPDLTQKTRTLGF